MKSYLTDSRSLSNINMAVKSLTYTFIIVSLTSVHALQQAAKPIPQYFNIQSYGSGHGLDAGPLMGQTTDGSYVGFNVNGAGSQGLIFHIDSITHLLYSGTQAVYASTLNSPPVLKTYNPSTASAAGSVYPLTCSIDKNLHLKCSAKIPNTAAVTKFQIVQVDKNSGNQLALGTGTSGSSLRVVNLAVVGVDPPSSSSPVSQPPSTPSRTQPVQSISTSSTVNSVASTYASSASAPSSVASSTTKRTLFTKIFPTPVVPSASSSASNSQAPSNPQSSSTSTTTPITIKSSDSTSSTPSTSSTSTSSAAAVSSTSSDEFNIIGLVYGDTSPYTQSGSLIVGSGLSGSYIGTSIPGWDDNVLSFSIDPNTNILSSGGYNVYASNITSPPIFRLLHSADANQGNVADYPLLCAIAYNVTLYCQANQNHLVTPVTIDADHSGQRNLAIGGMNTGSYIDTLDLYVRPAMQKSAKQSANFKLQCDHSVNSNAPMNGLNLKGISGSPGTVGFYVDGPELSLYLNYTDGFLYTSNGNSLLFMDVTTSPQQIRTYDVAGPIPDYVYPLVCNIGTGIYLSCVTQESQRSIWWDLNTNEHNIALGPPGYKAPASLEMVAVFV